uniref:Leucine-rich repeat-containing N-terminal plant-type domain-containing protein n=1 Tax=Fagus sylvatica TaxID=28930 RepID=A0A2N9IFU4_FAGSY
MASFSLAVAVVRSNNITTDQSALLALKAHITDDPYNFLTSNWSTSTSVCNWIGISCGAKHQRVTALNLTHMGLRGTIPPHVGNLSFLTHLSFRNNSFHGSLPNQLASLRRLEVVSFGMNNFSGELPSWLGFFPKLQVLYAYSNSFSGSIPLSLYSNASSLQIIHLGENMLSGSTQ